MSSADSEPTAIASSVDLLGLRIVSSVQSSSNECGAELLPGGNEPSPPGRIPVAYPWAGSPISIGAPTSEPYSVHDPS